MTKRQDLTRNGNQRFSLQWWGILVVLAISVGSVVGNIYLTNGRAERNEVDLQMVETNLAGVGKELGNLAIQVAVLATEVKRNGEAMKEEKLRAQRWEDRMEKAVAGAGTK